MNNHHDEKEQTMGFMILVKSNIKITQSLGQHSFEINREALKSTQLHK